MEKQKAALYIRVSTQYQISGDSLNTQLETLTKYAELILKIQDITIFEDAGFSGKNTSRPAYQKMMKALRQGEYTHLLVWKIDRISRNLLDFADLYQELKRLRISFISFNEQFDTSTAIGEAMLKIILVFAELERNMTAERVRANMIARAQKGFGTVERFR
ncbi:recombinase family protein [Blautia producta]|uniref:recombinase family protein n=1 Tax=Blautia producta TaxID=33035 RepID=UPI0031B5EA5B